MTPFWVPRSSRLHRDERGMLPPMPEPHPPGAGDIHIPQRPPNFQLTSSPAKRSVNTSYRDPIMRSLARYLALLPLLLLALALPAHADPMDNFTITGGGQTIDFYLPASTTQPCCSNIGQFNFGQVTGTVNGVSELIGVNFITGSGCAVCGTILLEYPSTNWTIFLPSLYGITYSGNYEDETLTFIPGDYPTEGYSQPYYYQDFEINVTSETAATPEPPTLLLVAAAALGGFLLMRRRALE